MTKPTSTVCCRIAQPTSLAVKEAFFVITFNPFPQGSNSISVDITFFDLVDLKTADANGIIEAIKTSFEAVNIEYLDKHVGFGAVDFGQTCGFYCFKGMWQYIFILAYRQEPLK